MDDPHTQRSGWRVALRSRGVQLSLLVVAISVWIAHALQGKDADELGAFGWLGTAGLVVAQALLAVSPLPSQIVAVPIAVIHGFWTGTALLWCGWMLAALLQYALSRRTADDIDLAFWLARAPRWLQRFPADHPLFLILTRQLPIGPHIVNIAAGALHVPLGRHLGCAAIGIVPEALLVSGIAVGLFG